MYKSTGRLTSLSEQHLMDCSRSYGTYGCSGAWMANAYDYVVNNGLPPENSYPYTAVVRTAPLRESSMGSFKGLSLHLFYSIFFKSLN